jgi:hypothetical protein
MCRAPHAIWKENFPKQLAIPWIPAVTDLKMKLYCSHVSSKMLKNLKLPLFITARIIILKSENKFILKRKKCFLNIKFLLEKSAQNR